MSSVVIIGGGISGLASAALLAREGHTVTVIEKNDGLGGRAGVWEHDGFRFDTGPSWYLMPEVFDHFYKLLGTSAAEQLKLVTLDPGYRVYFEGEKEPIDISAYRDENIALFESIEKGAGAKLDRYLDSAKDTYDVAKSTFLYTTFASFRKLVTSDVVARSGTLVRLLLQPLSRLAARTVKDRRLRQVLGYPAVFLGSSPKLTPSMYHLMSHLDLADGVLYPMGGFGRVIESIADLARAEGVTIITGAAASRILVTDGKATGVEFEADDAATVRGRAPKVATRSVQQLSADIVVSAADLHHTETQLLEAENRTYPQEYWDTKVPGPSALLLYLGVKGELPQLEHHTLLFTRDWDKGFDAIFGANPSVPDPASLYVCKPSGVDPSVAPEGYENIFVLVPIPADPSIGRGDVDGDGDSRIEVLADKAIAQIAAWTGIEDFAERIVVRRPLGPGNFVDDLNAWRGTALGPAHTLKQSAFFRAGNKSKKVDGLYFVGGSTIPGIGLPMCLISAEILIKRLNNDISTGPLPEPLQVRVTQSPTTAPTKAEPDVADEVASAAPAAPAVETTAPEPTEIEIAPADAPAVATAPARKPAARKPASGTPASGTRKPAVRKPPVRTTAAVETPEPIELAAPDAAADATAGVEADSTTPVSVEGAPAKPAVRKPAARRPAAQKTPAQKAPAAPKAPADSAPATPAATATPAARKPAARKPAARKPAARKPAGEETGIPAAEPVRKAPVRKPAARTTTPRRPTTPRQPATAKPAPAPADGGEVGDDTTPND